MEAQGHKIENNILYQDNRSNILLDKSKRISDEKNSKNINNMFFPIAYKVAQRELDICHMDTKSMWEDVNTNPVQGALFRIFQSEMMGLPVGYNDDVKRRRTNPLILPIIET